MGRGPGWRPPDGRRPGGVAVAAAGRRPGGVAVAAAGRRPGLVAVAAGVGALLAVAALAGCAGSGARVTTRTAARTNPAAASPTRSVPPSHPASARPTHRASARATPRLPPPPRSTSAAPVASLAVQGPCGGRRPGSGRISHVVWIWFENRSSSAVLGSPDAPYINRLAGRCGLETDDHNVTHPSLPNYLAAVSGSTGGVSSDCGPDQCPQSAPTIFGQLDASGRSWAAYAEGMPGDCALTSGGEYATKHNPAVYYPALRGSCQRNDVPLGDPTTGAFGRALATGTLRTFSFVTPDLCHDMHDCSTGTGDGWLAGWLPALLASPQYRDGSTAVFITWDEGEGGSTDACVGSADVGCQVPLLVLAPQVPAGLRVGVVASHYALLRTTEALLGQPPLGAAAQAPDLAAAFGL